MATRSIIQFTNDGDTIAVYKHWDGYPESTVPLLQEFCKWNGGRNGDLSYTVANFCYWFKSNRDHKGLDGDDDNHHTGIGVLTTGDEKANIGEEYVYVVDFVKGTIEENYGTKGEVWDFKGTYEEPVTQ